MTTTANHIDNTADILDVRDLIARLEELRTQRDDFQTAMDEFAEARANVEHHHSDASFEEAILRDFPECAEARDLRDNLSACTALDTDETEELAELQSLLADLAGMGGDEQFEGTWYPVTLIRDSYFKDYAQDLAEDTGMVDEKATWPMNCIDWEQAARELRYEYSAVYIGEIAYWTR